MKENEEESRAIERHAPVRRNPWHVLQLRPTTVLGRRERFREICSGGYKKVTPSLSHSKQTSYSASGEPNKKHKVGLEERIKIRREKLSLKIRKALNNCLYSQTHETMPLKVRIS